MAVHFEDGAERESVSLEERSSPSDAPLPGTRSKTSISAQRLTAQLLDESDREFVSALRAAGLVAELDDEELLRIASEAGESEDEDAHRVTLLELYYDGAGARDDAERRRRADRFFVQRVGEPATAAGLVTRLTALAPELGDVVLERIGGGDGPLVLRSGDHVAAVLDDYEEETDTGDFDLAVAEARKRGVMMVTVRGLVRAINVLLDRREIRTRLVALRGDDDREVYVGLGITEALSLARAGHLDDEDPEQVMDLGAW